MMIKRILCWFIGGVFMLNSIFLLLVANVNLGYIALLLLGILLVLLGFFYKRIARPLRWIFLIGLLLWFGFGALLFGYGWNDTADYKEDLIIVLGAGIKGDRPTNVLQSRLDEAAKYHRKNPDAMILVSGGQGPQEIISEAAAMAKYLKSVGIAEEKILLEERSTSTFENFTFSKEIADAHFEGDYKAAFISNDFHILRAKGMAKDAGIEEISHLDAKTPWYNALPSALRETLAIAKYWILGN